MLAIAVCIATAMPVAMRGQQSAPTPAVIEAGRSRDAGRLAEAVDILRKHRAVYPEDGDAARMLAQTLYWIKDVKGARALYDSAIALHHKDEELRLQYARMLMETGDTRGARQLLARLGSASASARAAAILGTIAYWDGDLTAARRLLEAAATADPANAEAKKQLAEIRSATAPWVRVSVGGLRDDQPVRHRGGFLETGHFVTPLWSLKAVAVFDDYYKATPASLGNVREVEATTFGGSIGIRGFVPSSRIDITSELGGFQMKSKTEVFRTTRESWTDWTRLADVGIRPSSSVRFGARFERAPYLYTESSLSSHVMTNDLGVSLDVEKNGWLGRAAYGLQRFPDDNSTTSGYAWAMAPIVRANGAQLQAGYSASYQNAKELRFVERPSFGGGSVQAEPGYYSPYYTPRNVVIHSIVGAFTGHDTYGLVARLGGSYGVRATEDAPSLVLAGGSRSGVPVLKHRTFHPWTMRASVERPVFQRAAMRLRAEHSKTAFYVVTNAALELTWRLAPR